MEKQDLINIIGSLKTDFSLDELAFLALTSKAESVLRDAISYRLHIGSEIPKCKLICKEWKRIDLAVIDPSGTPEILIEFKAHSSIDFPKQLEGTGKESMLKDIKGMLYSKMATENTEMYFIYFNNLISKEAHSIPENLKPSLGKYWSKLKNGLDKNYLEKIKTIVGNWMKLLEDSGLLWNLTSIVEIKAGDYYELPVSVLAFIYGPLKKCTLNSDSVVNEGLRLIPIVGGNNEFDVNDIEIILENEEYVDEIRKHIERLVSPPLSIEKSISNSNSEVTHSETRTITDKRKNGETTITIKKFSDDTKGLRVGDEIRFPESRKKGAAFKDGEITRIFKNNDTGKEEASIKSDRPKPYFRYEHEITKFE